MPRSPSNTLFPKATTVFRRSGGILRTQETKAAGIHSRTLAALVDDGTVLRLARGVYQLADSTPPEPDLAIVARKVPRGFKDRKLEHPPVRFYRFGDASLNAGVERIKVAGRELRVYSAAKTVADCFKFRNKIGRDIAIEALRTFLRRKDARARDLMHFTRINCVQAVMAPYIESVL